MKRPLATIARLPLLEAIVILVVGWGAAAVVTGTAVAQEEAEAPQSPVQREIAEAETVLERLAALEREWEERAEAEERLVAGRLGRVVALEAELADAEPGSEAAGDLFDRSKELLRGALADLRAALGRAASPSEVPRHRRRSRFLTERGTPFSTPGRPAPEAAVTSAEAARLEELEGLREERTLELEALELKLRDDSIERRGTYAGRLWLLRLAALETLPAERRDRIYSLTRERWAELVFDFEVWRLAIRIQQVRLGHFLTSLPHLVRDFFAAAAVGGVLARVLLVMLLWRWAQSRRPRALERLRQRSTGLGRARIAIELTEAAAPWSLFLLGLAALRWALGPELRELPLIGPLLILAAVYGGYRLAADLLVAALAAGAARTAVEMTGTHRRRLERGVRRVLRVLVVVVLVLALYVYRLEGGVLYEALRNTGLGLVALAALAELAPWRRELADACLAARASGGWASLVRRTRDRRVGILVAPLSFLWLSGRGLAVLAREIASGYERTRLATAYLVRRRIEREAQERGYADVDIERLPAGLAEVLAETVRPGDVLASDHFPGLEEARRSLAAWRRGGGGGAFMLAGESGIGKRAWVDRFAALEPVSSRLVLDRRLIEPPELIAWLGRNLLGEDEPAESRGELAEKLAGGQRIVILEAAENLFLAQVNGYRALGEMAALAGETRRTVFWLLSMEGLAFNHLRATSRELTFLRRVAVLPEWSEEQIRELLHRRLAAGGFSVSYAELLGELRTGEDTAAREREGEKAYLGLLWDFAAGNPRVALHYFLRSLVPKAHGELSVRPFRPPPEEELAAMSDEAHFLLAAVARHGTLHVDEASAVTGYPVPLVAILLTRLLDLGAVIAEAGRYRVTHPWQSTVHRLLRRRNILIS